MLQFNWHLLEITTEDQAKSMMLKLFQAQKPRVGSHDTETTGLNIVLDKPFLFQFGWVDEATKQGYAYAVDLERHPKLARRVIKTWNFLATTLEKYPGKNIKFDLHMLENIGLPYNGSNVTDVEFYIRLGHDALRPEKGGPPMGLKEYTARYITPTAKVHENVLHAEQSQIANQLNTQLIRKLNNAGVRKWTKKIFEDILIKDAIVEYTDLDPLEQQAYLDWLSCDVPAWLRHRINTVVKKEDIPYNKLNREAVIKYAMYDIVYALEIFYVLEPVVAARQNEIGIKFENDIIYPLYEMERVGFKVDVEYLLQSRVAMKNYIIDRREHLQVITGQKFKVGQHALIKSLLSGLVGKSIESSKKDDLLLLKSELQHEDAELWANVIDIIDTINELRTLEKWYSTYILRFIKNLHGSDRLYTQINQVGTVSGRVTSDFQQFPKHGIVTRDGESLFSPRHLVMVDGGDYDGIVYLDYSQIELRFQAMYTILVGHPDMNLCRAYMPYECHTETGVLFDCHNSEHIRQAYTWHWFQNEDNQPWTPTDVHGATTEKAFHIDKTDERFHDLRYVGKRVNFAKNYGASYTRIKQMFPEYDDETVHAIDDAYYAAFPGVKKYHEYCMALAQSQAYATNLFGIRYYGVSGHNLKNMLVQGSAAYFLKWKIKQIYDYTKENNIKSKFQMNIHDELSWQKYKTEDTVFTEFQTILQTWEDSLVPVISDMELTKTTWEAKVEVEAVVNDGT